MSLSEKENVIRILEYRGIEQAELTKPRGSHADVSASVREILEAVRTEGDEALLRFTERFDHVRLDSLQVTQEEWDEGLEKVDEAFMDILRQAFPADREGGHVCSQRHGGLSVHRPDGPGAGPDRGL